MFSASQAVGLDDGAQMFHHVSALTLVLVLPTASLRDQGLELLPDSVARSGRDCSAD